MRWFITCDFDGTLVEHDSADLIFEQFATSHWRAIEERWQQGLIGSATCMQQQVALMKTTPAELNALLDTIPLDPAFPLFAHDCNIKGIPLVIVSDGLDYVIHYLLRKFKLDYLPIIANHLNYLGQGQFVLTHPYSYPKCQTQAGVCKCAIIKSNSARRTLHIGDGRSDFCAAHCADLVLAKGSLLYYCQAQLIPHLPFADFTEARHLVNKLITTHSIPQLRTQHV
jgi:2,3-diketo-5-methylthio-1-phosphopentane phosphatase